MAEAAPAEAEKAPEAEGQLVPTGNTDTYVTTLSKEDEERLLKEFYGEVKEQDRHNEVNRILGAFKLNPFEQLGIKFDTTREDIRKHYRKVSLLVHPDKCSHPRAGDAFDILGQAQATLVQDDRFKELQYTVNMAREELRKERKKATKNDAVVRLASAIHEKGREGVEMEYEQTPEFHEAWKLKSRDMIAQAEWRRRKLGKRMKEEQLRLEESEADMRKRLKSQREHHKEWEENRESRVGTWRDFAKGNKSKKGKNLNLGGIRPPKLKMEDEDKTYIQRPVGEQFRPPPPVAARPRSEAKTKAK